MMVGQDLKKAETTATLSSALLTSQVGYETDGLRRMLFKNPVLGDVYYLAKGYIYATDINYTNPTYPGVTTLQQITDILVSGFSSQLWLTDGTHVYLDPSLDPDNVGIGILTPGIQVNFGSYGRYLDVSSLSRDAAAGDLQAGDGGGYLECDTQNSGRDGCLTGGVAFTGSNLSQTNKRLGLIEVGMQGGDGSNRGGIMHFYIKQTGIDNLEMTEGMRIRETGQVEIFNLSVGSDNSNGGVMNVIQDVGNDASKGIVTQVGPATAVSGSWTQDTSTPTTYLADTGTLTSGSAIAIELQNGAATQPGVMMHGFLQFGDKNNGDSHITHFTVASSNEVGSTLTLGSPDSPGAADTEFATSDTNGKVCLFLETVGPNGKQRLIIKNRIVGAIRMSYQAWVTRFDFV
jgi:hypothetical protein